MKFSKAVKCILGCFVFIVAAVLISREIKVLAVTSGEWEYEKVGLKEVKLTKYLGSDKKVKVPKKFEGYTVSEIGDACFTDYINGEWIANTNIEEIILPETIKAIGRNAFRKCYNLKSLRIPSKVETIGHDAFTDAGIIELIVAANIKETHSRPGKLQRIVFEEGVTTIPDIMCSSASSLDEIIFPSTLQEINDSAFALCKNLKSIVLPESLIKISKGAFTGCNSLKEITIPSKVEYIGTCAFNNCTGLENIYFLGNVPELGEALYVSGSRLGVFANVSAYVTYPKGNSTWESLTEADKAKFGFKEAEWKAVKVKENKDEDKNDTTKKFKLSSVKNTAKGIKIKWKAVDNAAKYEIYRQTGSGKKKFVKTVTKLTYTDKKASKEGTEYTYTIVALSSSGEIIAESTSKTIVRTK